MRPSRARGQCYEPDDQRTGETGGEGEAYRGSYGDLGQGRAGLAAKLTEPKQGCSLDKNENLKLTSPFRHTFCKVLESIG